MKISIDIDCSPAEARAFFGLPDLTPLQDMVVAEMTRKMEGGMAAMDPARLFGMVFPQGTGPWEELQKAFWGQMTGGGSSDSGKKR